MKQMIFLFLLCSFSGFATNTTQNPMTEVSTPIDQVQGMSDGGQTASERQIVQRLLDQMGEAYESNKMFAIANVYASDAVFYDETGNDLQGAVDISSYWMKYAGAAMDWTADILETEKLGDQVLAVCDVVLTRRHKNRVVAKKFKTLLTIKKVDGTFKITRDFHMPIEK